MQEINDPFLYGCPIIDLHGYDKVSSLISVDELITDAIKLDKYKVVIIHGKGSGILKNAVHEYLSKDKRVIDYKTDYFNDGMTIVNLKGYK